MKSPPEGLDPTLQDIVAKLIAHATAGYAGLLSAAIVEAGAHAPPVETSVRAYVEMLGVPAQWVANKVADAQDRAEVMAIYREFKATGKVIKALSEDDRTIRALHAKEVLKAPLADLDASPARAPGGRYGQAFEGAASGHTAPKSIAQEAAAAAARQVFDHASEKVRLRINDPVVNAPAIGPKTAERLETIGVMTVADLMALDPAKAASDLATRHITAADVADWQAMAQLQMDVPALNAIDTQLLVALGVRDAAGLAGLDAADFAVRLAAFVRQADGQRLLRNAPRPDAARVAGWVAAAKAG
jgi:predicted flap endonuclease-1-like 5' DNA nuclease